MRTPVTKVPGRRSPTHPSHCAIMKSLRSSSGRPPTVVLIAAGVYLAVWVVAAIAPVDRFDWLLENLLVFAWLAGLLATYRRFPLSSTSYLCIFAFLALHAVGAHYTYSATPLGFIAARVLGFTRNHYDRVMHFGFGLLFAYPMREVLSRTTHLRALGLSFVTVALLLAASAGYELVEWAVALVVDPHAAYAYLGTQGDVFDSQKDESLALLGALVGVVLIGIAGQIRCPGKPR